MLKLYVFGSILFCSDILIEMKNPNVCFYDHNLRIIFNNIKIRTCTNGRGTLDDIL